MEQSTLQRMARNALRRVRAADERECSVWGELGGHVEVRSRPRDDEYLAPADPHAVESALGMVQPLRQPRSSFREKEMTG